MKYRVLEVLFGLVFLVGLYLFAHDTVADQINNLRQDRTLSDYQETVSEASPETYEAEMQAALAHNAAQLCVAYFLTGTSGTSSPAKAFRRTTNTMPC